MKSKREEASKPPRYTELHLEKVRQRYLFTELWNLTMQALGRDTVTLVPRISDEELELKARLRRDVLVDMLRDGILEKPDVIQPRGPHLYVVTEECTTGAEFLDLPAGTKVRLGSFCPPRKWEHAPSSKELWTALGLLSDGGAQIYVDEDQPTPHYWVEVEDPTTGEWEPEETAAPENFSNDFDS